MLCPEAFRSSSNAPISSPVTVSSALVNRPELLLADEPTGALDTTTGEEIGALLLDLNASGQSLVLVTHNPDLAARYAGRTLHIVDGRLCGGPAVQVASVAGSAQAQVRP